MVVIDEHDLGKTTIQLLTDLIYESEGFRIPEQKINYGKPQALDVRPDILTDANTFVPVRVQDDYDDRYPIGSGLMYRRRELGDHFPDIMYHVYTTTASFRLYELLDQLNLQISYPLTSADVLDQALNLANSEVITLRANPDSYIWINNATIRVTVHTEARLDLLTVTDLTGFN